MTMTVQLATTNKHFSLSNLLTFRQCIAYFVGFASGSSNSSRCAKSQPKSQTSESRKSQTLPLYSAHPIGKWAPKDHFTKMRSL